MGINMGINIIYLPALYLGTCRMGTCAMWALCSHVKVELCVHVCGAMHQPAMVASAEPAAGAVQPARQSDGARGRQQKVPNTIKRRKHVRALRRRQGARL